MSGGFEYFDIILFAMIAAFLVYRLGSVLGKRTGHERRSPGPPIATGAILATSLYGAQARRVRALGTRRFAGRGLRRIDGPLDP